MRDALLVLCIVMSLVAVIRFPFAGLIVWAWFTLMTPHQAAYGGFGLPLNLVIAAVTIASIIMHGAITRFRSETVTCLLIFFAFWLCVSQAFSLDPENSATYFDRFIKTLVFVILCVQMTTSRLRLNALVWTLVISIGYFAVKGAVFTVLTLGQYHVFGFAGTLLEDNNHLGIAMAAILPLILYLHSQARDRLLKRALIGLFGMTMIAILGTQSRGAFLSLVAFCGYFFIQSRHKLALSAGLAVLLAPAVAFMPAKWSDRMATIGSAMQDESFMGRVNAWIINTKFALENPVTGAGLRNPYQKDLIATIDPSMVDNAAAAHSIYFEILGGAGFVGLGIFLSVLAAAFFKARRLASRQSGAADWARKFAFHAQVSLVVFCVGGASTSMEMWDGYWIVIALIAAAPGVAVGRRAEARRSGKDETRLRWRVEARGAQPRRPLASQVDPAIWTDCDQACFSANTGPPQGRASSASRRL